MAEQASVGATLAALRKAFREAGLPTADLDARLLVLALTGLDATALVSRPDAILMPDQFEAIEQARLRRLKGEPVHRILGFRDFHGVRLSLSAETLEPRPDTEILVDAALPFLHARVALQGHARLLDLGTGTGAIAIAILAAVPGVTALATDISADALETAGKNATANGVADRFEARRTDWYGSIEGRFDLIVSNPPYIETAEIGRLDPEVAAFDPLRALDGGADGLDAYRAIVAGAANHLEEGGRVALEIGWSQRDSVTALFEAQGWVRLAALRDLGGNDRVLVFERPA